MSLENVMQIAGSGMSAQSIRLNVTASNLANANTAAGSEAEAYHAKQPVFSAVLDNEKMGGVKVSQIIESNSPIQARYEPGNPLADNRGYVYMPNVNTVDETANMISASRDYRTNVDLMNASKTLMLKTLSLLE